MTTKTNVKTSIKPGTYYLPDLPYGYKDLGPHISEGQLKLHHQKHHQAYVTAANNILEKLEKARKENSDIDVKAAAKELAFNVGGIQLHNLFWQNMAPAGRAAGENRPASSMMLSRMPLAALPGSRMNSLKPLQPVRDRAGLP
jgi:superoxide dismutase